MAGGSFTCNCPAGLTGNTCGLLFKVSSSRIQRHNIDLVFYNSENLMSKWEVTIQFYSFLFKVNRMYHLQELSDTQSLKCT